MDDLVCREMNPADPAEVAAVVALRNDVFPDHPVAPRDWAADRMSAAVAVAGGEIVGAIPLAPRELVIAPGVTIAAPFENSVGTRADLRGRGVGAAMIDAARAFLAERADGLFVYRGGERSAGHRFYAKTGHHDLMATRSHRHEQPTSTRLPPDTVVRGADAIGDAGAELWPIFASCYGPFGGYRPRSPSFWRGALASSIFVEVPTEFALVRLRVGGATVGYAVVGVRTKHQHHDGLVHVLELATRAADRALAEALLALVAGYAAARGLGVEVVGADDDPFRPVLAAMGFVAAPRGTFLMGQLLDPPRFFRDRWAERACLGGVGLRVATQDRDHALGEPAAGRPTLTLEMKEATLHGWLLGRVDLGGRLREGNVTAFGAADSVVARVCAAVPLTPWAFHAIDEI